jgi:hypothetical protein
MKKVYKKNAAINFGKFSVYMLGGKFHRLLVKSAQKFNIQIQK